MKANWLAIGLITMTMLSLLSGLGGQAPRETTQIPYSAFLQEVESGQVQAVVIRDSSVQGVRHDGTAFRSFAPDDPGLVADLLASGVEINAEPPSEPSILSRLIMSLLPFALLIAFWVWMMRRQGMGGPGGIASFGKSRARQLQPQEATVTLADVAGVDEAKEEVGEMVTFLKNPERFTRVGGKIPRGVLMVGPPGTGKTLLARAIAGEAGVPFFSISGSDFVEMFVGVGASRVRDLFKQAKTHAPCIIFIDEIDAVGRRRGAGLGGGHDEREQTLNAMLVEMDGFEGNEGVIVVAATNRPDVLDPALLRPGRFDRQVVVPLPDVNGRGEILKVHMRKVAVTDDVEPAVIARATPGFSGADLANLVNEAALVAARDDRTRVGMQDFEQAKDKIIMGAERRSLAMTEEEKLLTAYHEAGHTIVGRLVPEHDPVHKVTIIPRGRALGVTMFLPERDRLSASKRRLESEIATLFGGRIAEELIFGADAVTTGAQNDIERATQIARNMVTKWGLSDQLGPLAYAEDEGEVFLGQAVTSRKNISDETARLVDTEVRALIDRNYERARQILQNHSDVLHRMAKALMELETLDSDQIDAIMEGRERPGRDDDDGRRENPGANAPKHKDAPPGPDLGSGRAVGPMTPQHARQSLAAR